MMLALKQKKMRMTQWWQQLGRREQTLCRWALVIMAVMVLFGVSVPTILSVMKAEKNLVKIRQDAASMQAVTEQVKRLKNAPSSTVLTLDDQRKQVKEILTQLNLTSVETEPNVSDQGLQLKFDKADYGAVLTFIQMLHTQLQLRVLQAEISNLGEGKVDISLQFARIKNSL